MNSYPAGDLRTSIRRSYLVCATPRSGSNFFCEVLQKSGVAGRPDEYFWNPPVGHEHWGSPESWAYLERIWREGTTPNGVFGVKIMWSYLGELLPRLAALVGREGASPPEILAATFPHLQYVWLTRQDKVRQSVSFYRAVATRRWRSTDPDIEPPSGLTFDFQAIDQLVELAITSDQGRQQFFKEHRIRPLIVVYEDLDRAPGDVAAQVLRFLGIPQPVPLSPSTWRHQRQTDALTDAWARRYHGLKGQH